MPEIVTYLPSRLELNLSEYQEHRIIFFIFFGRNTRLCDYRCISTAIVVRNFEVFFEKILKTLSFGVFGVSSLSYEPKNYLSLDDCLWIFEKFRANYFSVIFRRDLSCFSILHYSRFLIFSRIFFLISEFSFLIHMSVV